MNTLHSTKFKKNQIIIIKKYNYKQLKPIIRSTTPNTTLLQNNQYTNQNLLSLLTTHKYLHKNFLLININHLIPHTIHKKILTFNSNKTIITYINHNHPINTNNIKIQLQNNNIHIHKINKQLTQFNQKYIKITQYTTNTIPQYLQTTNKILSNINTPKTIIKIILKQITTNTNPPTIYNTSNYH